jgi:hypothetical protein
MGENVRNLAHCKYREWRPSRKLKSYSAASEVSPQFMESEVALPKPSLVMKSQINPMHTLTSHFKNIIPFMPKTYKWLSYR